MSYFFNRKTKMSKHKTGRILYYWDEEILRIVKCKICDMAIEVPFLEYAYYIIKGYETGQPTVLRMGHAKLHANKKRLKKWYRRSMETRLLSMPWKISHCKDRWCQGRLRCMQKRLLEAQIILNK